MNRTNLLLCVAATTALFASPLGATLAETTESTGPDIVSGPVAASKLELRDLQIRGDGSVTGTVVNGSGVAIKDVELLLSHTWAWADERHPGENNPGRSSHLRVTGEIPPDGTRAFAYVPEPPLPMTRTDGTFQTTAAVQSFTEIERN